jgi:NhaP-type Na+/H+ and K+/H+ antiporter
VPILLGTAIVHSGTVGAWRAYAVVVVAFSVVVQGGTVPAAARRLRIPIIPVQASTILQPGGEVPVLAGDGQAGGLAALFTGRG